METIRSGRGVAVGPLCALAAIALAAGLRADPVTLGDPSFEGNVLNAGQWTNDLGPEWQETNGPNNGNGFEEFISGFSSDGTDHLGMNPGHDVWQDLGVIYQADTRYTLTVAVGNRSGTTQSGNLSTYALADTNGTVFGSAAFDASRIRAGTFAEVPALVFDTASNPAAVGKTVRVLLRARGSGRSHFDNIRLDATSSVAPGAATIVLNPATGVGTATATLNAEVTDIGDGAPTVTFFYGTSDGGFDPAAWEHSVTLPGTHDWVVSTAILGLAPATSYFFTARATNDAGDGWAAPSESFETLALPPTVENLPAAEISATTAELGASVTATGGDNPLVTIYYGPADGGTDPAAWAQSVSLGTVSGQESVTVAGLSPGTDYHFRAWAENSGGGAWAASSSAFSTPEVKLAVVTHRDPQGITGTTATLRGEIDSTGGDVPTVTIFYGPADGGTNPANWAASAEVGLDDGNFSSFVLGLQPETTYWFRCRAVNAAGAAWAADSDFFTTTGLVPSGVVINEIHYDPDEESTPGEFLELHNPGDTDIDLGGWQITDAVQFVFPAGTTIPAGGYLVVAQDPATISSLYGVSALGPWVGRLNNDGEQIDLRDETGSLRDQVLYGAGFPWPTASRGTGASAELINPSLDRDLGGSWRASSTGAGQPEEIYIPREDPGWHYRKGTSEASEPMNEWRSPAFSEDGTWEIGQTSIGYGYSEDNTVLSDMRGNYSTVYLRHEFTLDPEKIPASLTLRVYTDDGAVVWINGTEVARLHAPDGELPYDATGNNHEAEWEEVTIPNSGLFLIGGTNVLAIHALNVSLSNSSDFSIDAELLTGGAPAGDATPTPGMRNSVYSTTAPPQIRQVEHSPKMPVAGVPVIVTAKITDPDGMGPVTLSYQTVDPGSYIRKSDSAYETNWTDVPMLDDGLGADDVAGDFVFTAELPASLQVHRRLVRYKISFEDSVGAKGQAPWPDDECPNFAYFVYNGIPQWTGSFAPGGDSSTFTPSLMGNIPAYHLIANQTDVINSQYNSGSDGVHMFGTLVYEGKVYDHIEFENRGEASTYVSGKNKWRFHFCRARSFQARDNWGRLYKSSWNRMNFDACASPWAAVHRGMAGVEEVVSYRLYELCGVPSPRTHYVHFRVVDNAVEADPSNQYEGDMWGLYTAIEHPDGSFLNDRDLPDGNVYKIEGGGGDKKEQGLGQPADSSDWNAFYSDMNSAQSESWWRANLDMDRYYSFRACNRISGNVDLREGYNHYFYHNPDGYWVAMPWDLDMMFIAETHWPGYIRAQNSLQHAALALEFRNRSRELLDLMCSDNTPDGGQIGQLIDEYAQMVNPFGMALTWADLDANMWNYNPRTRGNPSSHSGQTNHKGNFFYTPFVDSRSGGSWTRTLVSSDHEGSMRYLLDYATDTFTGGTWQVGNGNQYGYGYEYLKEEAEDAEIPNRPVASYSGGADYPTNDLVFASSGFSDPQGSSTFGGMRWRLAEISAPGLAGYSVDEPRKYEVETVWDSGEMPAFATSVRIPVAMVRPGHTYRVRVRHKDTSERWSHWSEPVQFVAGEPDVSEWRNHLVISEIMYNPPPPTGIDELAASTDNDDFEFIELRNISTTLTLDLTELRFTKGVDFDFVGGAVTSLAPGEYVLVVRNVAAFEARYGTGLPVAGIFVGTKLSNGGEQVKLSYGAGTAIRDFAYDDRSPWPSEADGDGPSLVLRDPASVPDHSDPANWMASRMSGGTPGAGEPAAPGTYDEWSGNQFTSLELLDPSVSGPDADPDGDARSNFYERAFGTDPHAVDVPSIQFVWSAEGGAKYPAIRFHRPEQAVDLFYQLEACDDMDNWQTLSSVPSKQPWLLVMMEFRPSLRTEQR